MALDGSPLLVDGSCVFGFSALNSSTYLGSTALAGPSGSGQYLAVRLSTTLGDRTLALASTATTGVPIFGIVQNKGSTGQAAAVGYMGNSKAVCGSTTNITGGVYLEVSSTAPGTLIAYSSAANVYPVAIALEQPSATGAIFSVRLGGPGGQQI
jgi:hypothetical protein